MTFLQPILLWGLLAAATPILIHFVNRMRHRPMPWGAMLFLARARRSSTKFAKLRRFLILACRALALAMVALLLSRPLLGGFAGRLFAGPPELVVIILDRSASMEARSGDDEETLRQRALRELAASRALLDEVRRVVVLDSATGLPVELPRIEQVADERFWQATDTGADIPALVERALALVAEATVGRAEIWLVSDLQASNWQAGGTAWQSLGERLAGQPREVVFRLLPLRPADRPNAAVRVVEAEMRLDGANQFLDLAFEIRAPDLADAELVVGLGLDGRRQNLKLRLADGHLLVRRSLPLDERLSGWGVVELPADGNDRDNRAFFAWEPPERHLAVVVAEDAAVGRILALALAPLPGDPERAAEIRPPGGLGDLSAASLLVWQGQPPQGGDREQVDGFLALGGQVLFLPGRQGGGEPVAGVAWLQPVTAPEDEPWSVAVWDREKGLLADSASGIPLTVDRLRLFWKCGLLGEFEEQVATLADGTPFLAAVSAGRGRAWFCPTLPARDWSTLGRGTVLLPLLQRLLAEGGRRFGHIRQHDCGTPLDMAGLVPLAGAVSGTTGAGVFRNDGELVVLRRPAGEDLPGHLDEQAVRELFGEVPLHLLRERAGDRRAGLQSEIWWVMALLGLLFMLGEGLLTLPPPRRPAEVNP